MEQTSPQPELDQMKTYLAQLAQLVRDEADAAYDRLERIWAQPIPDRVSAGHAIEGVRFLHSDQEGNLYFTYDSNRSRFREGDILCLNLGNPKTTPSWMVTLEREEPYQLIVSTQVQIDEDVLKQRASEWMFDEGFLDLSHYILATLDRVGDSAIGRAHVLPLLMNERQPIMDIPRYERGLAYGSELFHLNWMQSEALAQAYATDLVYLIQGPPGTGKTRVLAHIAQLLANEGERVLITAATHRAINNALNKLAEVAPEVTVAKVGQKIQADDLKVDNYEKFDDATTFSEKPDGYVIGATPFALQTTRLKGVEFETVIFDEASQITLPLAMMGMLSAKKYIFIGDHKQLPPVFQATDRNRSPLRQSIFGALIGRGYETMLTETYRLNAELVAWPSASFYDHELVPSPQVAQHRIIYTHTPARYAAILDPEAVRVFVDLKHQNATTHSQAEANVIVSLVESLLACGVPPSEIGIVAPYRAQGREIRDLLQRTLRNESVRRQIVTDTVERLQGQERDVILISLTTSNPTFATELAEFFFQPERLNVSVTRPRKKLIIVGSGHVLNAQPADPELLQGVELLRELLRQCEQHVWETA